MRILAFLIASIGSSSAALEKINPLLPTAELAQEQSETNVTILKMLSGGIDVNKKDKFSTGYIARVVKIPYAQSRSSKINPSSLIDISVFESMLEAAGFAPTNSITVVYGRKDAIDFGAAAHVYWTLKTAGFENLSIPNGGMSAWRAAQYPIHTGEAVMRQKTEHSLIYVQD